MALTFLQVFVLFPECFQLKKRLISQACRTISSIWLSLPKPLDNLRPIGHSHSGLLYLWPFKYYFPNTDFSISTNSFGFYKTLFMWLLLTSLVLASSSLTSLASFSAVCVCATRHPCRSLLTRRTGLPEEKRGGKGSVFRSMLSQPFVWAAALRVRLFSDSSIETLPMSQRASQDVSTRETEFFRPEIHSSATISLTHHILKIELE